MDVTTALGTSILAFILGVLIGISLGYVLWAEKDRQRSVTFRTTSDDRLTVLESGSDTKYHQAADDRLDALEKDSIAEKKRRGKDESK